MGINLEGFFISYELEQMSRYLDMVTRSLASEFEKTEAEYKLAMERELEDYEDTDKVIDDYQDKYFELVKDFPKLIYGSFITAWYSFVEQTMLDICEKRKLQISVAAKENANLGKGIWRARKFLMEAASCKIDERHWQELLNINRLRNFIVHSGYKLTPVYLYEPEKPYVVYKADNGIPTYFRIEENLDKYLQKYSMAEYSWTQLEIVPTLEYCEHLIDFGKKLFKSIFDDLGKSKKT